MRVYPRVGGGTAVVAGTMSAHDGLSPRGRGNPYQLHICLTFYGSIPAWAGEPSTACRFYIKYKVYPRVGGEPSC